MSFSFQLPLRAILFFCTKLSSLSPTVREDCPYARLSIARFLCGSSITKCTRHIQLDLLLRPDESPDEHHLGRIPRARLTR